MKILVCVLAFTMITAGIVVYAAADRYQGQSLPEESVVDGESVPDAENAAMEERTDDIKTGQMATEASAEDTGTTEVAAVDMTADNVIGQRAAGIVGQMTVEQKVAQMFFVTPEQLTGGGTVTAAGDDMRAALDRYPVGGIVFFAKNLQNPEQTKDMLKILQEHVMQSQAVPVFLGVDEEGGRVLRVGSNSAFGVERIRAMGMLAVQQDTEVVYDAAAAIGAYLSDLGFNVDFAPDADVITNEANQVIGDRSFGSDPEVVSDMAWAYTEGLHEHGILACYKHFPGHGGTVEDSHSGYAYSYKTLEELGETELVPFQDGCDKGIEFVMVSHVSAPNVTGSDVPATLSEELVTGLLREGMGYQGIIITDSMNMGAVSEHYTPQDAAVMAVQAGCDMLLMSDYFEPSYNAVLDAVADGRIPMEDIDASVIRIVETKIKMMQ